MELEILFIVVTVLFSAVEISLETTTENQTEEKGIFWGGSDAFEGICG